jgi:hypothetical protein
MEGLLRGGGLERRGPRRAADRGRSSSAPGRCRGRAAPFGTRLPRPPSHEGRGRSLGLVALWRRKPQHPAAWGGPRAGARLAPAMANPRCSKIARTPPACFTYAKTRRLPPLLTQNNTSMSNVLLSNPAQSTRGVLSFSSSLLAPAWGATLPSSSPAWGSVTLASSSPAWGSEVSTSQAAAPQRLSRRTPYLIGRGPARNRDNGQID